jgi:hypothetical protein
MKNTSFKVNFEKKKINNAVKRQKGFEEVKRLIV